MSWLLDLAKQSKAAAAARLAAGKSRTGSRLKPKDEDSGTGPLGGSLPGVIRGAQVQTRPEGYTVNYPIKVQWFQQGSKKRGQPARRVIGLSKDEIAAHRAAAVAELKRLGRRLKVFR